MEIYTVNNFTYLREKYLERYESFIWKDRYSGYGDFQMVVEASKEMQTLLTPGVFIGFSESKSLMEITRVLREEDSDGKKTLKISGDSLESILENRLAKQTWTNTPWTIAGTPAGIVAWMVHVICVLGQGISTADKIRNLVSIYTDPPGAVSYTLAIKAGTLYQRVKELCDSFDLGFRFIMPTPTSSEMRFEVYFGTDRSGPGGVAFSSNTESLSATSYLQSIEDYKNVAYVYSAASTYIVIAPGPRYQSGLNFDRRVMLVDATDLTATGTELTAQMLQRGRDALTEHTPVELFDGVVTPGSSIVYNVDYFLGDIVALVGDLGVRQPMRVTEFIWSDDEQGFTAYPTLSALGGI